MTGQSTHPGLQTMHTENNYQFKSVNYATHRNRPTIRFFYLVLYGILHKSVLCRIFLTQNFLNPYKSIALN